MNNEQDPIPTLPPASLGFLHVAEEIHILGTDSAVLCPGAEDTTDAQCIDQTEPSITDSNILNHLGPCEWPDTAYRALKLTPMYRPRRIHRDDLLLSFIMHPLGLVTLICDDDSLHLAIEPSCMTVHQ